MDTQTELFASLTRYCNYLAGRNISGHTITAYRTDLSQFFSFLSGIDDVSAAHPGRISATHVSDFLSYLSSKGRSGLTRVRKLAAIREYCKYLVDVEKVLPPPRLRKSSGRKRSAT
jgi:integrase/recombinase XerC